MNKPWLCESIRLTALWRTPEIPVASALSWEMVTGVPPESKEEQPRTGTSRQAGPINEGRAVLQLQTAPGRADWVLSAAYPVTGAVDVEEFPNVGGPAEALEQFDKLLFDKAARAYASPRFALGLIAVLPTSDVSASYAELTTLLKSIHPDLTGTSDFQYQINRARRSKSTPNLTINRLSRWSSMSITGMQVIVPMVGAVVGFPEQKQGKILISTRSELDINSAADRTDPIPEADRLGLFREFGQLALEILDEGDTP